MKRILLIGIGRWGANHLRVLKSMPIELFVADHHEQRLSSADIPESHRSTDARSLFPKIDAAVVVTPAPAHFETCRELLEMERMCSWKNRSHWSRARQRCSRNSQRSAG